jgi:hypothetical protein
MELHYTTGGKLTAEKRKIAKEVYDYTPQEAQDDYKKFMEAENKDITPLPWKLDRNNGFYIKNVGFIDDFEV